MVTDNTPIRLLLVDDEEEFRNAAGKVLAREGFQVAPAASGEAALEAIAAARPEVVVLDLRLPGIDGIETLRQLRRVAPHLPVIILTGHGQFADALAGIQLDVVDFVQKPVDLKLLALRIRRLLAGQVALPLREKTIRELMVPANLFRRVYSDVAVSEAIGALREASCQEDERVCGTLLVFDRHNGFVGLLRVRDVVWLMVPAFLQASPYSSYFTGMFLAQSKVVGQSPLGELVRQRSAVEADAPLMEAVAAMAAQRVGNLPIVDDGSLIGVLRDEDIFAIL